MIHNTTTIERTGNMTGTVVAMGVAEGAMHKLMGMMTDLYDDAQMACIREYSCNAWDAHIEAGVNRPIEVRLPQGFNTNLEIQDFGVGMDVETIHNIYSQYGASTKDTSNDAVGMFGIGCKAALSYTDQFVVTSIKDGVRIQMIVSREAAGGGNMTIVDTRSTDEGNGTTISIPVGSYHQFPAKAAEFFAYWPEGSVLVDGAEPKRFEGIKLSDNLYVVKGSGYHPEHRVVMGNVAYPVPAERLEVGLPYGHYLVAYVPIGTVAVPAPREGLLLDDSKTIAALSQLKVDFAKHARSAVQREVDGAADHHEAIQIAAQWHGVLNRNGAFHYTYKGVVIPQTLPGMYTVASKANYGRLSAATEYPKGLPIGLVPNSVFITGWNYAKWSPAMRRKLDKYVDENNITAGNYVMCVTVPATPLVKSSQMIKWDDIKKIKIEQTRTQSGRIPGSYDLQTHDDGYMRMGIPGDDIDTTKPVFYTDEKWQVPTYTQALREIYDEFTLVYLPSTRQAKFKRNVPSVKNVKGEFKAAADKWAATVSTDHKKAYALHQVAVPTWYTNIAAGEKQAGKTIKDPRVSEFGRLAKIDLTSVNRKVRMFRNLIPGWHFEGEKIGKDPIDDYPLFNERQIRNAPGHVIDYMNWHYTTTIEPKEA